MARPTIRRGTTVAKPKPRMAGEARRRQLIDSALQLFATRGFEGTTTKAIADAAGVSEAIIFRHFANKKDLYESILRQKAETDGVEKVRAAISRCAERDDDEGLIFQIALKTLEAYRRDPNFQRLMFYSSLEGHELAKASHRMLGLPMFDFLREYVAKRQAAGAFREGDPRLLVFGLIALPVYYAIVARLFEVDLVKKSDREAAKTFTQLILNGLRCERVSANVRAVTSRGAFEEVR